jgi:hypothetical protein
MLDNEHAHCDKKVMALRLKEIPERPLQGLALIWMFQKNLIGQFLIPLCPAKLAHVDRVGDKFILFWANAKASLLQAAPLWFYLTIADKEQRDAISQKLVFDRFVDAFRDGMSATGGCDVSACGRGLTEDFIQTGLHIESANPQSVTPVGAELDL